jgi:hypothetical protein
VDALGAGVALAVGLVGLVGAVVTAYYVVRSRLDQAAAAAWEGKARGEQGWRETLQGKVADLDRRLAECERRWAERDERVSRRPH